MFKNFIKLVIDSLVKTYEETYGCEELTKEFYEEIKKIKNKNKILFLEKEIEKICKQYKKINKKIPPYKKVRTIAEENFVSLKNKGELDELNTIIKKRKRK